MSQKFLLVLCLVVALSLGLPDTSSTRWSSFFSRKQTTNESKATWSSFFTVDPSRLLTTLINHGGLLMPKSVEKELQAVANVIHVSNASLNLVEKEMKLLNFTVGLEDQMDSLRLGRVEVKWDSYIRPCVDIHVENVTILVEFTNLQLTRTNWNDLEDAGFPPAMEYYYEEEEEAASTAESSTFVRIGSIRLSGNVRLEIVSRPLNKTLTTIVYDMSMMQEIDNEIRQASDRNLVEAGRRGCTTDELYDILQTLFSTRVRKLLRDTALDVIAGFGSTEGSSSAKEARRLFANAGSLMKAYVDDAGKKTGDSLEESLSVRLERLGMPLPRDKLRAVRETALEQIDAKQLALSQLQRLKSAYQASVSSHTHDLPLANEHMIQTIRGDKTEEVLIIFPDW